MHRFFLSPEQLKSVSPRLVDSEAHHFQNVLRGKVGDRVTVFDGAGHECLCAVAKVEKNRVALQIQQRNTVPPLPYQLTLAQAILKGRNMDFILQKATELGTQRIVPLLSDRTVVHLEADDVETKVERWKQITIEAAKQCGANWLPAVESPMRPREFFSAANRKHLNLIASLQSDSRQLPQILKDYTEEHGIRPKSATIVIGPEGDFTPAELADARSAGFRPLTLGPLVLRSETAAIYALSILAYELQQVKTD
jgi:16S rRNA (uracil1498-N3)-methyltransferase